MARKKQTSFMINTVLKERLDKEAKRQNASQAYIIELALIKYLDKQDNRRKHTDFIEL